MLFLSKCRLNTNKPVNPYELHQMIWQLFPDRPDDSRDFLFRIENYGKPGPQIVYLQSQLQPTPATGSLSITDSKAFSPKLSEGQYLRFLVRANPTKRINDPKKTSNQGKVRVPLIDEGEMAAWLQRQFENSATLSETIISRHDRIYFRKKGRAGKIVSAVFQGILQVNDPLRLTEKLRDGIGPAKAFGCGLLSLARC
ncbi:MAG: type I-E CRISPR-associated protein Cas6/Cse3/CasE [Proteobacteria bacterium]|nr:type I-E CRISPR-associated protein Cas6/Cse3/CasE [Pseudomonadota bacterium]MBU1688292.1 type I-E CRISPR-associated protein Cas6/Cse3/CasE [Pseudomonadota bacterium]